MNESGKKPSILIVDDEPEHLRLLAALLKKKGYKIRPVRDGKTAIKSAAANPPDLVLLDIIMPGIGGLDVCAQLKSDERTRCIPVIFITGLDRTGDKLKAFSAGGIDYVSKPFQEEEVLARVETHLALRKLQSELEEERDRFRCLSEATFEGIVLHDRGIVVEVNRTMETLTGFARTELIGANLLDLVHPESRAGVRERMRAGDEKPHEALGIDKEGNVLDLEVQARNIRYQGRPLRMVAMRDISAKKRLERENLSLRASLGKSDRFGEMVGKTAAMKKVYEQIVQAAASNETVVIYGETGTGKEMVARTIFQLSDEYKRTFVSVNCAAVVESLFESQFFGYCKGAFTGAQRDMPGFLEQAHEGTLFLDEVGELTPAMQAKLLRFLQNGEYTPVGAAAARKADVRIIAATNRELRKLMAEGRMREDFFHRLHVIAMELPPLRFRKADIPLLIQHFLERKTPAGEHPPGIPERTMQQFQSHRWPGNVRELFNELRRYLATGELELAAGPEPPSPGKSDDLPFLRDGLPLGNVVEAFERHYIERTIKQHEGNKKHAAQALGVTRKPLYNKLGKSAKTED